MDENDIDTAGAVSRYLAGRNPQQQARASMAVSVGISPDQEAEYRRLAQQAGVPLDTVRNIPDEVKKDAALKAVPFDDLAQRFPSTTRYLSDPGNAAIAHDDVDGMSLTEGLVNSFKRGLPSLKQNLAALGMGYQQPRLESLRAELEHRRGGGAPGRYAAGSDDDLRAQMAGIEANNSGAAERIVTAQGEKAALPSDPVVQRVMDAKGFGEAISAFSTDPVKFVANIGPESLIQSAPGLVAAVTAGPAAGAAAMGGGSFAVDYGATLLEAIQKEGVDISNPEALIAASKDQALMRRAMAQATAHAGVVGAFDAVSGGLAGKVLLPGKVASKLASRPLAREIANLVAQAPLQGALGGLGELGGELAAGQDISPGNILAEIVGEAFTAPVEAAAVARTAIRERMQQAQAARENAEILTQLAEAAQASKVRGRDPQSFKAFIDSATENGPVQEVYLSPQSLAQSGVDIKALAEASPAVAEQIDAANASGADIRIPVSEFASDVVSAGLAEQLIPHLRTEADGMTMAEAEEFIKTNGDQIRAEVEKALAARDMNDANRASRDAVQVDFFKQIMATGRYSEDVAKPQAAAAAAFYATMAGRLGITAEQLYQQFPLTISAAGAQAPSFAQSAALSDAVLSADEIQPINGVERPEVFDALVQDMKRNGWRGRPVLVLRQVDGQDRALTGSHRIAAAREAGVDVPVVYVDPKAAQWEDERGLFGSFSDAIGDQRVAEFLRAAGDPRGADLYTSENRDDGWHALAQQDRGSFTPSTLNISLLETADLSTMLHEMGHAFLEITASIAARQDAPAEVSADLKTLLDWFGIKPEEGKTALETWRDMSLDEQRESHEKFARGFEAFLFEGKAPSVELQGVFQRFRSWLLNVYQSLKALNVKLTDEVRDAMGRMLASEQEIETAEAAQSMAALFRTPEEAKKFGLDWAQYQELGRMQTEQAITELSARSLRDMQWLTNARAKLLKKLQKDAAEKRRDMRSTVRTEVMAEPVYRAWAFLTGKVVKPIEPTEAEVEYRRELKDYRQKRIEAEEQAGKDERAAMLAAVPELKGLQKGQFLAKNKRQVDINVQQRMLEWDRANPEPAQPPSAQGDVPPGEEVGKLDLAAVKAIDKAAAEQLQKRRMTAKEGGIDPDVLAEQFSFTSGQQLIRALTLADTPNEAVEGLTDQRMLERYGDITSPEALELAVRQALFNEARQRAVATELKALERAMQVRGEGRNADLQRSTVATLPAAAKKFAAAMVSKLLVKDIQPNAYSAAQARAARAAAKALAADDIAAAAKEKRNELVNGYAFKAATDALTEIRETLAFFKQVLKGNRDTIAKTRDVNLVMAMRAILGEYGIGVHLGDRASEYLERVKAYDPQTYEVLRERVEGMTLAAQPYQQVSMERLRGLADEMRSMWEQSRNMRQIEVDGKKVDREQVETELLQRMEAIGIPDRVPGEGMAVTEGERRLTRLQTFRAALRRVESWVGSMDGGKAGPFRTYVWQPIKESADRYRTEKGGFLKKYRDLLNKLDLGRARIEAPELGYTFGHSKGGSGKMEILHALLHTGNESNKRKLLLSGQARSRGGIAWATENEDGTLNTAPWDRFIKRMQDEGILGKAEYDFAQGVWDLLEEMKPAAQKTHKAVFGHYFDEVTADGFITPFGTYRGGYVPAMTDAEVVKDAATRQLMEDENQALAYAFPTTSKGFTKARVEYNKPLLLDLRSLSQHIDKVLMFTHLEQPVRDVRKILASDNVSTALHRLDPTAFDGLLTPWLNRASRQQVETPIAGSNGLMRFFSLMRQRAGLSAMFANVTNAAQQITGLSIAALKVKPRHLASAAVQYMQAPKQTAGAVAEASAYMAVRMDNEVAQMTGAINDILLNPSALESTQSWFAKHAYFLQSAVDNVIGPIVWTGAYNQAIEAGETQKDAIRRADSAVRETQGSTLPEDVSRIETGNALARVFTQFASYFNMQANLIGTEMANTYHDLGLRKGWGRGLYILTLGFLVPAIVSEAIVQGMRGGPDDDDHDGEIWDDWLAALGIGTLKSGVAMVPGAGQAINAGINATNNKPYDDRLSVSPAVSMIESAIVGNVSNAYRAVNGEEVRTKKAIRDLATLIGLAVGIPASAMARPLGYLADVNEGRVQPTGPVDAARGAVTGAASPESKQ
jgi:hypothetical protein